MTLSYHNTTLHIVVNKHSVRAVNKIKFRRCLQLRKQGLSYSEIGSVIPVAKSTLQNWLTLSGLTLTKEHIELQLRKRIEKKQVATEASRITRNNKREQVLIATIRTYEKYFTNAFFVAGVMLYQAEGSKGTECRFSNSDYRLIEIFTQFIEKFFSVDKEKGMKFSLFIHETRRHDLQRIRNFWSRKLSVPEKYFTIFWKTNKVTKRRNNPDYVGQIQVRIKGVSYLSRKLLSISDIILTRYLNNEI